MVILAITNNHYYYDPHLGSSAISMARIVADVHDTHSLYRQPGTVLPPHEWTLLSLHYHNLLAFIDLQHYEPIHAHFLIQ